MKKISKYFILLTGILLFHAELLKAQAYKWGNVAMGGGGFVSGIITSKKQKDLIYARTDVGGAYRLDAATSSWIPLLDWVSEDETTYLGTESVAIDPTAPNKLYILAGISYFNGGKTAILRSDDYGKTFKITDVTAQFKAHGNGMGRNTGERLAVDPNNGNILFCGTRANGLFKSTDAGVTWARVASLAVTTTGNENGICVVLIDSTSGTPGNASKTIYAGVSRKGQNFYKSTDGGATWKALTGTSPSFMPARGSFSKDGNLYVTFSKGSGPHGHWDASLGETLDSGAVYKFNVATDAVTNVSPVIPNIATAFGGVSVDPSNPQRIVVSTLSKYLFQYTSTYGERIFLSVDGGASWKDVIAKSISFNTNGIDWVKGNSIHWTGSIEFDPYNSKKVWVTSGNGIFTNNYIDTSTVWNFTVKGLEETVPTDLVSIPNGSLLSTIGDYDGFKHTDITKFTPTYQPRIGTTNGVAYATAKPNFVVRVGKSIYYSTDQATTWTRTDTMPGIGGKIAVSANGTTIVYSPERLNDKTPDAEKFLVSFRSTDTGTTWKPVTGVSLQDAFPVADPVNSNKFYFYNPTTGDVSVSSDAGVSFSTAGNAGTGGNKRISAVPGVEGDIWIALYEGGLTHSTNSGQTFTKLTNVSQCAAVGLGKAAAGQTYPTIYIWGTVGNVRGAFRSVDSGATWVRVNDDEHEYGGLANGQFIIGDFNVFGRVYISTGGRGLAYGEPAGVTAVTDEYEISSSETMLAYPNPASNELILKVNHDMINGNVTLTDITGKPINAPVSLTNSKAIIDISTLSEGLYIVTYNKEGKAFNKMVSVIR